jgi:hypothetical protein
MFEMNMSGEGKTNRQLAPGQAPFLDSAIQLAAGDPRMIMAPCRCVLGRAAPLQAAILNDLFRSMRPIPASLPDCRSAFYKT